MNLLKEGILQQAVVKTTLTRKLTVDGLTKPYPVYKVRLDWLFYNDQNDRIATWISQYKAQLNSALALAKPLYMAVAYLCSQVVDDLFKRLDRLCLLNIVMLKRHNGGIKYLVYRSVENVYLFNGLFGEGKTFFMHFLCAFGNVYRMVGNSLKIAYAM